MHPRALLPFALLLAACGSAASVTPDEADAISARVSAGMPENGPQGCDPAIASWSVDLANAHLVGDVCTDTGPVHLDRALTASEVAALKADVTAIEPISPGECFWDAGGSTVKLKKGTLATSYFEGKTPCGDRGPDFVQAVNVKPVIARLRTLR
jgi:hypothetical protein